MPGYSGYVAQVKSENVYGKSYAKVSGMSREGQIRVRPRGTTNLENVSIGGKYRSTMKSQYKNAFEQQKQVRHADPFERNYDMKGWKPDIRSNHREKFP